MLKYNFGSNKKNIEGYINVDALEMEGVDVVQDLTKVPYAFARSNSVDEIKAEEFLEHVPFNKAYPMLKEWYRILKPGGILKIQVPDCGKAMEYYVKGQICECCAHKPKSDKDAMANPDCFTCGGNGKINPTRWLLSFTGAQKHPWDYHLNIFTKERLEDLLKSAGFNDIGHEEDKYGWKLKFTCLK